MHRSRGTSRIQAFRLDGNAGTRQANGCWVSCLLGNRFGNANRGHRTREGSLSGRLQVDMAAQICKATGRRVGDLQPLLEVQKPPILGEGHSMGAVIGPELLENALDPRLDRVLGYI